MAQNTAMQGCTVESKGIMWQNLTQAKRNFAAHSDLSIEIRDKDDRLKVLRDI